MELRNYFRLLWRWVWLLGVGLVLGAAAGYGLSRLQTPEYEAATTILIVRPAQDSLSDLSYLSDQQLAQTYGQLLLTRPMIAAAEAQLGSAIDVRQIRVEFVSDTQLLRVVARAADPQRAADVANTLVAVFTAQNEFLQGGQYTESEATLQAQIAQVEQQIADLQTQIAETATTSLAAQREHVQAQMAAVQAQIDTLQAQLVELEDQYDLTPRSAATPSVSARPTPTTPQRVEITVLQGQLTQQQDLLALYQAAYVSLDVLGETGAQTQVSVPSELQSALTLYQQIHASLLTDYANMRLTRLRGTPGLTQVEAAEPSTQPLTPAPLLITLVGALGGLALAATAVFLKEYLNDTLQTAEEIEAAFQLPLLGSVPTLRSAGLKAPLAPNAPPTGGTESFRALRTNLDFAHGSAPLATMLVTSPGPGEGKTTVAVNLALAWAQTGKRVLLIDADLRKPRLHRLLQLPNQVGLTDLMRGTGKLAEVLRATPLAGLSVITSGAEPADPSTGLNADRLTRLLAEVGALADLIVVDGPPAFTADALVLAAGVDGVLLTVQPGRARLAAARSIHEQFERVGARMVGLVLNRVVDGHHRYYGSYDKVTTPPAPPNGRSAPKKQPA